MEVDNPGPAGVLRLVDVADPRPSADEVVVDVVAAGVNRADTSQRKGTYNPPPGASPYPGLECSGVISQLGAEVQGWSVGDRVCALLAGGGYAEKVAVPTGQLVRAPSALSLVDAAALPESAATVWSNLFGLAGLRAGETVLLHGGSSGIGTMAIQLATALGATVAVTAGSAEKLTACEKLGASVLINYRAEDFVERVRAETGGVGVDVVLDIVGARYLQRNIDALAPDGRLVVVGIQSGADASFDLRSMLRKRVRVVGSMLRARPIDEKATIIREVVEHVVPLVESGAVAPVVHCAMPLADANEAHALIESSRHIGKVVLTTGLRG
jgi:putative PIG3 family NAD(P)H quinone oxidoreductase